VLCLCIVLPSPALMWLMPLTIVATELSPFLLVLSLLNLGFAFRFCRPAALLPLVSICLASYPIYQVHTVRLLTNSSAEVQAPPGTFSALLRCFRSIPGHEVQPQKLPLNILFYAPVDKPRGAVIINIYGGAWQHGAPEDNRQFDSYLALRGYAVFSIDYRHAPRYQFPAQIDDVETALQFLRLHARDYRVDPDQFILCGRSAGAQLALLAAYRPGGVPVEAVISFYGPTDLEAGYTDKPSPDPIDVQAVLRNYMGGTPSQKPQPYRNGSPVHFVRPGLVPTLMIHGARDHIVKQSFPIELFKALEANGDQAELVTIPWAEHAFDLIYFGLGNQVCLPYVDRFLAKFRK